MTDAPPAPLARALATGEGPIELPTLTAGERVALAWALKQVCHEAWSVEPGRAVRASEVLEGLAAAATPGDACQALAAWTAGLAALVQGAAPDALRHLDRAAAAFEQIGDSAHAAEAQVPKLIALSMLGRHEEAVACAQQLRQRFIDSGDQAAAGKVALNLGSLLLRQDRYADAAPLYRDAAMRFSRIGDIEHSVMADIGLATVLTWQFDFEEAAWMHERACRRAAAHGFPVLEALARGSLGQLELHRGHYARALRDALAAFELLADRGTPQRRIDAERTLADVYLAVHLLPEALLRYESVSAAARVLNAPVELAWSELHRAQALVLMHRRNEARTALESSRAAFEAVGNGVGVALAGLHAARLELQEGRHIGIRDRALAAASALGQASILGWQVEAQITAAQALACEGELDAAADELTASLDAATDLPQAMLCELALAGLDESRGAIDPARARYERAARAIERARASLPADDMRIAFAGGREAAFDALVRLAPLTDAREVLRQMERGRARSLRDALSRDRDHEPPRDQGHEQALRARGHEQAPRARGHEQALRARLNWLHQQWLAALSAGAPAAAKATALQARIRDAERQWAHEEHARRIGHESSPAGTDAGFEPELLLDQLDDQTAYVQFHLQGDRWLACVARRHRLQVLQGQVPGLRERLHELRFQMESQRSGSAALQRHQAQLLSKVRSQLHALHHDLIAPLLPAIGEAGQLVISAHRELHQIPFAALHDGDDWLMAHRDIVMAPSAGVWLRAMRARLPGAHPQALVVGYGGDSLPHVDAEAAAVTDVLGSQTQHLRAQSASTSAFTRLAPHATLIHLACHARARADNPSFSALHLADGLFTMADAASIPLRAELVTLSACDTAISRIAPGDEVLGLSRGFLAAGVPSVVASLWSVADASTAVLMSHFYRALVAGAGPARALGQAQRETARQHAHPFHWAAFGVHGRG